MITKKTAAWKINAALRCILYFCRSRGLSCTLFFFLFFFFFFDTCCGALCSKHCVVLLLRCIVLCLAVLQYCFVLYCSLLHHIIYCLAVLKYCFVLCCSLLCSALYRIVVLICIVLQSVVSHYTLPCTALSYCFVLQCNRSHCIIHCFASYCSILRMNGLLNTVPHCTVCALAHCILQNCIVVY